MPPIHLENTRRIPTRSVEQPTQKIPTRPAQPPVPAQTRRKGCGCTCLLILLLFALLLYFLAPIPQRFLILGIDRAPQGSLAGRSDTIMLVSVNPLSPTVKLLSIPRDLWVAIPGFGENRINAAHFFAEAQQPGSGPALALETIRTNLEVPLRYYVRISLEGFPSLVDAIGGITVDLPQAMAGLPAGRYTLNGAQALAFVRSRSDGDDFFRIQQGQLFISAFIRQLYNPTTWPRIPALLAALPQALDTNLPLPLWPRVMLALLRASFTGAQRYAIDRSMVTPTITNEGAQVLLPRWEIIRPYVRENF